jgi:hypothetical protein
MMVNILNNFSLNPRIEKFICEEIIKNLINNIQNYDEDERIFIKLIIHKIYGNSLKFRKIIMKHIEFKITELTSMCDSYKDIIGVVELIDFLECVIRGYSKPLKHSHIIFISRIVLPLMKNNHVKFFWPRLKEFLVKICEIDKIIAECTLFYTLLSWPVRYPEKITNYLELIELLFCRNDSNYQFDKKLTKRLLNKIITCLGDLNFLVSDRTMVLFKNDKLIEIYFTSSYENLLIERLITNIETHWSSELKIISKVVISKLLNHDKGLLKRLSLINQEKIESYNLYSYNEEVWDIQFALKAD